ncbi:MAG: DUF1360 domain-containing protein [Gammaproteobacteria bacterium]|nr:DUF1360 domain-containing protein [Gammaproteobacteria bacterium]
MIIILEIVFLAIAWFVGSNLPEIAPNTFYVLLALAAYRGGRAVAFNKVFEWLRNLVRCQVVIDSSGAGENVEACDEPGFFQTMGQLMTCPICAGTWVAAMLLVANKISPELGMGLIVILAVAGVAEILHWLSEFLSWNGRAARERAGSEWLEKNK